MQTCQRTSSEQVTSSLKPSQPNDRVTYSSSGIHVLGEHYALRLDDKEVDKLLDIIEQTLKRSLGDGEVLARTELGGKTTAECYLSSDFSGCGCTQCHVEEFKGVADDVEVTGGEDEEDGASKGDTGRARVLPAQETVEHAVVVCVLSVRFTASARSNVRVRFWPVAALWSGV